MLVVPLSFLVQDNLFSLIVVFCTGLGLYALMASIAPAVMSELFPTELRATGIGAWYNLTVATFGGTAPLVIAALSEAGHPLWFFWYVADAGPSRVRRHPDASGDQRHRADLSLAHARQPPSRRTGAVVRSAGRVSRSRRWWCAGPGRRRRGRRSPRCG